MNTSQGNEDKEPTGDWRASFREAGPYLGLGMQLAGAMIFFTGAGYLLDRWFGSLPWLTVAGSLVGMTAIFVKLVRISNELGRASKKNTRREPGEKARRSGDNDS